VNVGFETFNKNGGMDIAFNIENKITYSWTFIRMCVDLFLIQLFIYMDKC